MPKDITQEPAKIKAPTWRERFTSLRFALPLFQIVWGTNHRLMLLVILVRILRGILPITRLWVGKLILDAVVASLTRAVDLPRLLKLVAFEIIISLVVEMLTHTSTVQESLLADQFSNRTSIQLMMHASTLDLNQFENPSFYDQLERAREQATGRLSMFAHLLTMMQNALTLLSFSSALFAYSPLLLLLLCVSIFPSFVGETHYGWLKYSQLFQRTPERRQLEYLRFLGASDRTVKEVQMFGLAGWLIKRYQALAQKFYEENKSLALRKGLVAGALSTLGMGGYYGAYFIILLRTVSGQISLGTLSFLTTSFVRSRDIIQQLLNGAGDVYQQTLYLQDLFQFFELKPVIVSPPGARVVPQPIKEGFVFDDVGFCYPDSEEWAVRHLSFCIGPGERIALVGENGAGKTTITKLLARLYDPVEGRILLDGIDLREYDLESVRRAIGIIFQDFVRYDLRFDENIGIGEIAKLETYFDADDTEQDERPCISNAAPGSVRSSLKPPQAIISAAEKSLATTLLARLPNGYRQMLGRRFEGGVELSGGEWQKIALARAYIRQAQLFILDEPTASLDARSEYEVYDRFAELVAGRMAVIISHRFSTVRMADRIVVLRAGHIVEGGTHDELINMGGLYAELFNLQAEGYR